jgi:transglycosylase-like protein with SLT domain
MVYVPPQYQNWVNTAAQQLGIDPAIVAAQIQHESNFNNDSVGQYGEKGIVQFLPSTWKDWSSGSQTDLNAELSAYVGYMRKLLEQNNNNVYAALSAYNGDTTGAAGYAKTILDSAGLPQLEPQGSDNSGISNNFSNVANYIPQTTPLSLEQLKAEYPLVAALLSSVPELQDIAKQASNPADPWSPEKIIAAVQNSNWYATHSDTARQLIAIMRSDPSTYSQRVDNLSYQLQAMAAQLGVQMTPQQLQQLGIDALMSGYDQNTAVLNQKMAQYLRPASGNHYGGQAGSYEDQIRQSMLDLGVSMPEAQLDQQIQNIVAGKQSVQGVNAQLRTQAASMYPAYSSQINSGMNVSDIASPYITRAQQLLEMGQGQMNINTPMIKSALQYTQDGQPTAMPMYDFEKSVRQDPRWLSTDNAQDAFMSNAHQVLVNFGFEY